MENLYVKLRYNGLAKRTLIWESMGRGYSYTVYPGEIIVVPSSQAQNAKACAPMVEVELPTLEKGVKKIRKTRVGEGTISQKITPEKPLNVFTTEDPLAKYETTQPTQTIEVTAEDDFQVVETIENSKPIEELETVVESTESTVADTDFANKNKQELVDWLLAHGEKEKEYKLLNTKRDTLIAMCVEVESNL